ncbi:WbqC family protein [Rhodoblastus sp.]|uniref:WbqC family protein n=1 Tax=Rhodoblastus sp. TaxID=1962975 RepID=UPI003F9B74AF
MRLGIMQPYFFPYPGHFALIANVDEWVVFDITQYTPKSWISRNRVLHPSQGANWINVPLSNSSISIKIHEARVLDLAAAERTTLGKLSHYRRRAPFARQVEEVVKTAFASAGNRNSLVDLNVAGLDAVCAYLGLAFRRRICSELSLPLPDNLGAGEWAPTIAGLLGAKTYVNPYGGRELFDRKTFEKHGVALEFLKASDFVYETKELEFIPNLSILDALMWNSPDVVREALTSIATVVSAADAPE